MRILAVDDEYYALEALITIIRRILGEQSDVVIQKCTSARKAIEMIDANIPDVVFTDIRMEGIDGLDLCDYIHGHYPDILLVIISGHEDFSYAQRAIKANVAAYLTKPMKESDIREILENLSSVKQNRNSGNHFIQPAAQTVRAEQIDPLTSRLISYYMEEGKAASLVNLIEKIFADHISDGSPDSMAGLITALGRVIFTHPSVPDKKRAGEFLHQTEKNLHDAEKTGVFIDIMQEMTSDILKLFNVDSTENITAADKIKNYIDEHYFEDLNMHDLANNVFFISPNYLSNLLLEKTGLRFSKYLLKVRMENAKELLKLDNLTISEVASLCGYNSESHFISSFRRYYGTTPKRHRDTS